MNRRSFIKTLFGASLAPFIPLPKKDEYFMHCQKPINWKIPDQYDKLGMQRGIARELLMVDVLPQGAIPRYETDYNSRVWTAYYHSTTPILNSDPNYHVISTIYHYNNEVWVPTGRHPVIANNQKEAEHKLHNIEDHLFFKMTDAAGLKLKIRLPREFYSEHQIEQTIDYAVREIEKQNLTVYNMIMHPNTYKKYIKPLGKTVYEELTTEENGTTIGHYGGRVVYNSTGYIGHLWNTDLKLSNLMPENKILITTVAEYIGAMPIRSFTHQPYTNLYISEEGQVIINEKSILTLELV